MNKIRIVGAREHNLKDISVEIPHNKFVVITGISGSGKSTLAFDTIYAEGQRRYVESLSSYARQFLGQMKKPDVEHIEGLSPSIAIEQRKVSHNPRSIVATQTEVYDYLRLLYARLGQIRCYKCGAVLDAQSSQQIVAKIMDNAKGERAMVLAPIVKGKKGEHRDVLKDLFRSGFVRARVDNEIYQIEEVRLDKNKRHNIEVVVDRLILSNDAKQRLASAVETALKAGQGEMSIVLMTEDGQREIFFSEAYSCQRCGISYPKLEPRLFSFNSPYGACSECNGLGIRLDIDIDKAVPDASKSLNDGALIAWRKGGRGYVMYYRALLKDFCYAAGIDMDAPFNRLPKWQRDAVLYGSEIEVWGKPFEGLVPHLLRIFETTDSEEMKAHIMGFMSERPCPACKGLRLKKEALNVFIDNKNIMDVCAMDIDNAARFLSSLSFTGQAQELARVILREAVKRLEFCSKTGVGYVQLNRLTSSLSGGEAQRIRLATQLGSGLQGVLYVLDEPSIGLHPKDVGLLIDSLKQLRDIGNTLIVVEHDRQTILEADYVVDLGPRAGREGGNIVYAGSLKGFIKDKGSITAAYLCGRKRISVDKKERRPKGWIEIKGAREHNLKDIDVRFPVGCFTAVTGVSGSGKSSLVIDILYKAAARSLGLSAPPAGRHKRINGLGRIDKVILVDQDPIGRTPRSNPATYTGLFTHIRRLFAMTPEAKANGYTASRFSFNIRGGRCEVCKGEGYKNIEMHFLPDVFVECEVCRGARYNEQTLQVKYKGKNIADVLSMTAVEALDFFENIPQIKRILKTICDVGLEYIQLGQPATTLSGGEAQRIKLANELARRATGSTLYILDEPTTGLHFADEERLINVLHWLVDLGNTVIVIEHNMDLVKTADYIVDLGPDGGASGGYLVGQGTPAEIIRQGKGYTYRFLSGD